MKKIAFINVVCNGSTGKIMCDIAKEAQKNGNDVYCFFGRGKEKNDIKCIKIGNSLSVYFHAFLARIGFNGHGSYFATKRTIRKMKKINPDIIHIHNVHGYYLNLKLFFKYLKKEYKGRIIWTLHDCWAFTGHCSYFTYVNCNKWKRQCYNCPQLKSYPAEIFDTTKKEYLLKNRLFTGINNMTLTVPSNWLKDLISKSFLNNYKIKTIYNGINLDVFKIKDYEDLYQKYNIPINKKIILGVANIWEARKGLNIFLQMSKILASDEIIVLVGLNEQQIKLLPSNIIGIKRTENQDDLAKLYNLANVFVNPSFEETFSLVTAEAMACGTPVVVCGFSAPKELITEKVGIVVNSAEYKDYYQAYINVLKREINGLIISKYARRFSNENMINKYLDIYEEK